MKYRANMRSLWVWCLCLFASLTRERVRHSWPLFTEENFLIHKCYEYIMNWVRVHTNACWSVQNSGLVHGNQTQKLQNEHFQYDSFLICTQSINSISPQSLSNLNTTQNACIFEVGMFSPLLLLLSPPVCMLLTILMLALNCLEYRKE